MLEQGVRFYVLDGPVEASGYEWFLIKTRGQAGADGWVAAGKEGEAWIKPIKLDCPAMPKNLDALRKLASEYRLSCFSGVDITINARLEQTGYLCSGPDPRDWNDIEPTWFARCTTEYDHNLAALNSINRFDEWVLAPDVELITAAPPRAPPEMWPTVKVTGHFDDPAAKSCWRATTESDDYLRAITKLHCRNRFVITSMREIEG